MPLLLQQDCALKLAYTLDTCSRVMHARSSAASPETVTHVLYDSRKIQTGEGALFFALAGLNRNGTAFIEDAWNKGVRWFVVPETANELPALEDTVYLYVSDPLKALQELARYHREQFSYPVVGITGSVGKTTFKEWAFHVLSPTLRVIRSPKSFNSQIGVALSLLELHEEADVALIEAGISEPGEMAALERMIQPNIGVFTAFGAAHRQHFADQEEQLNEKLQLFHSSDLTLVAASISLTKHQLDQIHGEIVPVRTLQDQQLITAYEPIAGLVIRLAELLQVPEDSITNRMKTLPQLALRMETFGGINGNTIINDTYNLDTDALTEALHYQRKLAGDKKRVVIIGLSATTLNQEDQLKQLIANFHPDAIHFIKPGVPIPWQDIRNSVVLVKSSRELGFEKEVSKGRELKHRTVVEIHLSAIRHNVNYFRKRLKPGTKILCMVKASSYGSGAERVAAFLQQEHVDYFGVAFADEGVALRASGITVPIVVMNADPEHAATIIEYQLEPAIYSFDQLDTFVTALIHAGKSDYPVHLKFDTGMHRLGFSPSEKEQVLASIIAQPEVRIRGLYSHLSDADNRTDERFTRQQITTFDQLCTYFRTHLQYPFIAHVLNSEGALHYTEAQYNMIRLGIILYGYSGSPELSDEMQPAVRWKSAVSQVKTIPKDDYVGYGCTFQAPEQMTIAVVPVGYADGFRRSLSNGKGSVYIHGKRCPVVGRVCMDMIMVDTTGLSVSENDEVEIIGTHQSMEQFALSMETIPYEVMTGLSRRMHRIYVED